MVIPHIEQRSHRTGRTIGITASVWYLTLAFAATAIAGENAPSKRHSLIHRPIAPASPVVAHPETSGLPSRPIVAPTPTVTALSPSLPHHKLMKKPFSPSASNATPPEAIVTPKTSARLASAGSLSPASTATDSTSKNAPAPVSDRPIVPIAPIAVPPLSMSSIGSAASPGSSRSLAAAAQSTAAANSGQASANLSPSMARLIQLSPGFAALLQPSSPVVASPSNTPPPAAPPSTPPSAASTGSVTLSWSANAENDLAGYKIYFGTSSGNYTSPGSPAVIGKITTYLLTGLQRNTTYFFALSAYDSAGNESALSAEVSRSIL